MKNTERQIVYESLTLALASTNGTGRAVMSFMSGYLANTVPDISIIFDEIIRSTVQADLSRDTKLIDDTIDQVVDMMSS